MVLLEDFSSTASHLHGNLSKIIFSRKIIIQLLFIQVINGNQLKVLKSDHCGKNQQRKKWEKEEEML